MTRSRMFHRCAPLLLLPLLAAAEATPKADAVRGDYVETRTASVFAGACHYNGERVTEGKSALLAWRIEGGTFDGVELGGVKLVAAVSADDNLAERSAARRTAIVVDADSDVRADAAVAWAKSRASAEFGTVVSVARKPVTFTATSDAYTVRVDKFASIDVKALPDRACCSQPELVWYPPLTTITDRRVGYTVSAALETDAGVGTSWSRADENSTNYGKIAG